VKDYRWILTVDDGVGFSVDLLIGNVIIIYKYYTNRSYSIIYFHFESPLVTINYETY
jgi:hypothetical protein